jgi:hypothetical protein
MNFVRESHKNPLLPHSDTFAENNMLSRGQEIEIDVKEQDKTACEITAGQMSLHHGLLVHGSGPNTSEDRRIACVIRFVNPNAKQHIAEKDYAMLARGRDTTGNFIHVDEPDAPFSPDSLRLHAEIQADQKAALARDAAKTVGMYQS